MDARTLHRIKATSTTSSSLVARAHLPPAMSLLRVFALSLLVAVSAESNLRGSGAAPRAGQQIGCTCSPAPGDGSSAASACQCSHSEASDPTSEEDKELEQFVLNRTKELSAWWQSQNETTRLMPWSGPLLSETQTSDLWVAAGHAGRVGGVRAGGVAVGGVHAGGVAVGGVHAGGVRVAGGCSRGGGCGCVSAGCGCAAHRGCAAVR